jgi:hypothetical protein
MDTGTIVGASLGSAAVAIVATLIALGKRPRLYEAGPYTTSATDYLTIGNWFRVLYYFLPYGLFLFGVIYDGLVRKIKFFPAGFIGLAAVYLNSWISYAMSGGVAVTDKDVCGIPGMSAWGSHLAPNNILFSTTVMSYIAAYITASQSDASYSGAAWGGVGIVFAISAIRFYFDKCGSENGPSIGWIAGGIGSVFIALAVGMLIGGGSGYGFSTLKGDTSGIGLSSEANQSLSQTSGPAMASTSDTAGAGKCSPTSDDDQFVCEAYKNGELVTSTIVE